MEKIKVKILQEDSDGIYADNGIYYTWGEIELSTEENDVAYLKPQPEPKLIKFKCKPTYAFQSVEFEIECMENYLDPMFNLYKKIVQELTKIAPEQPQAKAAPVKPASAKQIEIMDKFNISYHAGISYEEADQKIQESMKRAKSRTY